MEGALGRNPCVHPHALAPMPLGRPCARHPTIGPSLSYVRTRFPLLCVLLRPEGRAGLAQLADVFVSNPKELYSEGQSVRAQVRGRQRVWRQGSCAHPCMHAWANTAIAISLG